MSPGSARTKRWRKKHPEKARALARAGRARWRVRYPEKQKSNNDKYNPICYMNNREARIAKSREWGQNNPLDRRHHHRTEKARKRGHEPPPHEKDCPPRPDGCECCGEPMDKKKLRLDHCHKTGSFLGWCCDRCNTLGDDIERLEARIVYLKIRKVGS